MLLVWFSQCVITTEGLWFIWYDKSQHYIHSMMGKGKAWLFAALHSSSVTCLNLLPLHYVMCNFLMAVTDFEYRQIYSHTVG